MKFKLLICIGLLSSSTWAQTEKQISEKLNSYMLSVRTENYLTSPDKSLTDQNNAEKLLPLLNRYYNDSISKVRHQAYYLTYKATYKNTNQKHRTDAVYSLVNGLKDTDAGIVGNVADWLTNYKTTDFSQQAIDSLRAVLHSPVSNSDGIIKLVAFAGLVDQVDYLQLCLNNKSYKKSKEIWTAHLALARLGDESETEYCINQVKKIPINDDVTYELIPDLVYTRQRKAIDYVVDILQSTEKNCYSANPENPQKIECGYRIMEYLAPVIKNFPLEMDSTGDLVINDYTNALTTVRKWFIENNGVYEIITDTY